MTAVAVISFDTEPMRNSVRSTSTAVGSVFAVPACDTP
jgi:hypothetical protein